MASPFYMYPTMAIIYSVILYFQLQNKYRQLNVQHFHRLSFGRQNLLSIGNVYYYMSMPHKAVGINSL